MANPEKKLSVGEKTAVRENIESLVNDENVRKLGMRRFRLSDPNDPAFLRACEKNGLDPKETLLSVGILEVVRTVDAAKMQELEQQVLAIQAELARQ